MEIGRLIVFLFLREKVKDMKMETNYFIFYMIFFPLTNSRLIGEIANFSFPIWIPVTVDGLWNGKWPGHTRNAFLKLLNMYFTLWREVLHPIQDVSDPIILGQDKFFKINLRPIYEV